MASEEALRKRAITLYRQVLQKSTIARTLGRSREWVYKWISRYESGPAKWHESKSHAPVHKSNKTPASVVDQVVKARHILDEDPHMESGAYSIWYYLTDKGIKPPSVNTFAERFCLRETLAVGFTEFK